MRIRPQAELSAGSGDVMQTQSHIPSVDSVWTCKPNWKKPVPHLTTRAISQSVWCPWSWDSAPHLCQSRKFRLQTPSTASVPQWCSQPSGNQMQEAQAPSSLSSPAVSSSWPWPRSVTTRIFSLLIYCLPNESLLCPKCELHEGSSLSVCSKLIPRSWPSTLAHGRLRK